MKVLVTCPPMLLMKDQFIPLLEEHGYESVCPEFTQVMTEEELIEILPECDGWIIGDDPATRRVLEAGVAGKLKACVKWGIGVDNVDFEACKELGVPVTNTPNMFGKEVADIALGYVIALARETFSIHEGVKAGNWPKPQGMSLAGKTIALIGYGDIGKNTAKRLLACDMNVIAYDPFADDEASLSDVQRATWPNRVEEADFIVVTCALTESSYHMVNEEVFALAKTGVRVVNVGRGPVIKEKALDKAIIEGKVYSAALDVFEIEPLPSGSILRLQDRLLFGSHNSSNTKEAVKNTNIKAINYLIEELQA